MARVKLLKLAHARSGDKGDTANVGLIAYKPEYYSLLVEQVTAERVKEHFKGICFGDVERFEVPNLHALNFLLHESLDGGGDAFTKDRCARQDLQRGAVENGDRSRRFVSARAG